MGLEEEKASKEGIQKEKISPPIQEEIIGEQKQPEPKEKPQKGTKKGLFGFGKEKKGALREEKSTEKESELTDALKRLQAEFENYIKRSQKENSEQRIYANAKLVEDLLPVLDALEQGIIHNKEFVAIYEQLIGILKKNGLEKISIKEGQAFEHDEMDCLMQEENEKIKEGNVCKILLSGYKLNGKILRHAKVSVAGKINENKTEENENNEEK